MAHQFRLPDIGEGLTEAEIVEWSVAVGDDIDAGQTVVEIETAKTTVEIPSPYVGVLLERIGDEGDTIQVGDILFVISGENGEDASTPDGHSEARDTPASAASDPIPQTKDSRTPSDIRAVPAVRKLAGELGVDLASVTGSGPGGAITRRDVRAAVSTGVPDTVTPLTGVQRSIAHHMTASWTTIPHVTVQAEVRAEAMVAELRQGTSPPASVEAMLATAVLPLLHQYPEFNASFRDDAIVYRHVHNLGFAVDTDAGLLVAVVHHADTLSLADLTREISRVQAAAMDGTLTPTEATGQTFTISNIGALGGGHGTPIVPMGTSAIVSIGRALDQPVVHAGALEIGLIAPMDLSYDHRIIDGSLGQRFLSDLVSNLETIHSMLG
jgi:pyruvate dehydrogenase E2 component (dihydrolipoamide acetyltransferase)